MSANPTSIVYTMFYDRPPSGSKTRVTSRPFILASNPNQTYLPPPSWPPLQLGPDSSVAASISPALIDAPSAKANTITTDALDLTGLNTPSHNPFVSVVSMQYFTIQENPSNSIRLNGKIYRQNSTLFLYPGSTGIRVNASTQQSRDAEYVIIFTEERDWTDRIALSVFLTSVPAATHPLSGSQSYFSRIQTAPGVSDAHGVPLSKLFSDLSGGGAYTYHGSTLLPETAAGSVSGMTWYVFENNATIVAADLARLWKVADPSGNLYVGPTTPSIATTANVFYLPRNQITYALTSTASGTVVAAQQCRIVQTNQYYDPATGTLRATVEGNQFVPVSALLNGPAGSAGEQWSANSAAGPLVQTVSGETPPQPAIEGSTIETILAIVFSFIIVVPLVVGFLYWQGVLKDLPAFMKHWFGQQQTNLVTNK